MKTDSFFYRFFREYPWAFFALIGEDERKARKYKFTSVEVKEQAFRFDGVFLPKTNTDPLHFTEVQFRKETDFYARFFGEIFLYLRQNQPPNNWRAVVFFPNAAVDPGIHPHYQEFFESGRLQRIYLTQLLKEYPEKFPLNLFQVILASEQEVAATVKRIVRQLPGQIPDKKERENIVELLVNLLMDKLPQLPLKEIKKMVEPLLSNIKKSRAYREMAEEAKQELTPKIKRELTPKIKKELTPQIAQELTPKIAQEKARMIARALLKKQMSIEFIMDVTGLSQKELRALNRKLAARKN